MSNIDNKINEAIKKYQNPLLIVAIMIVFALIIVTLFAWYELFKLSLAQNKVQVEPVRSVEMELENDVVEDTRPRLTNEEKLKMIEDLEASVNEVSEEEKKKMKSDLESSIKEVSEEEKEVMINELETSYVLNVEAQGINTSESQQANPSNISNEEKSKMISDLEASIDSLSAEEKKAMVEQMNMTFSE